MTVNNGVDLPQPTGPVEGARGRGAARARRWFLGAAGLTTLTAAAGLVSPAAAQAAGRTRIRRVTILEAVQWRYDPHTKVTTVTKARKHKIRAKFVGSKVYERNSKGAWKRIPYVWDNKRHALVYSRALYLRLHPPAPAKPGKGPVKVHPAAPSTGPVAASAKAVTPYVGSSMAWHLARRATYGPSPALLAEIGTSQRSMTAWLDRQLSPASLPDTLCDTVLKRLTPYLRSAVYDAKYAIDNDRISGYDLQLAVAKAHIARALWSKRQLLTVMEDFWGNHFNVPIPQDVSAVHRADYANVIRARALGRFSDLLKAVETHPAMLSSLGNRYSDKLHPNENQARELLELHTVGVDAGYGETGVLYSARILTGLSVDDSDETYHYHAGWHWTGWVKVLGFTDANASATGGEALALRYFDYLAKHPATAHHLAHKLATHFVSDTPPAALVNRLAAVYLYSGTAIAPVLRTLFTSPEFAASAGAKVARPLEQLVSGARLLSLLPDAPVASSSDADLKAGVQSLSALYYQAQAAGHAPFGWRPPDGYPDVADAWLTTGSTLTSWNNKRSLLSCWWPSSFRCQDRSGRYVPAGSNPAGMSNVVVALENLLPATMPATNGQVVAAVGKRMFGLNLPSADVNAVCTMLGVSPSSSPIDKPGPSRWNLNDVVTVLVDSPYGLLR